MHLPSFDGVAGLVRSELGIFMERIVYYLVFGLIGIVQQLPLSVCVGLGRGMGAVAWALFPQYRRLVRGNLETAFGKDWDRNKLNCSVAEHFRTLGANLISAVRFFAADEDLIRKHTTMENLELLLEAHAKGRGVILAISHIGNWELFAQACFYAKDLPFGTVFQRVHNRYIDARLTRSRERRGVKTFDRSSGLAAAARFLREGGVLGVLVDQHSGDSGLWTPLFDRLASTSPLAASLACKTGAAVVPVAIFTSGFARWRISVRPEIPYTKEWPEQLTADINRVLEFQIRESPMDWFWVHNRWKLPSPDFLLTRSKRGIFLPAGCDPGLLYPLRVVVRTSNWLGDAVMNVSAVRSLLAGRPDLQVSILTPSKLSDLWRRVPGVREVISIPSKASPWKVARMLKGRFDVAIILPNSFRSALEAYLPGIPRRVGFPGHARKLLMNSIPKLPKRGGRPKHHSEHYLRLIRFVGGGSPPVLPPVLRTSSSQELLLGICPGAEYGPAKRWPAKRYREVMEAVSSRRDCRWVVLGVDKDLPISREIVEGFQGKITDLTGKTSLDALMVALTDLRLLLTNDTGSMHLASFLGIPTVAIFGSTEPSLTGPVGNSHTVLRHQVECSPCFLRDCPLDFRCMHSIEPGEVVEAVLARLESSPRSAV